MKKNPYWFFQKWGVDEPSPLEVLEQKVKELEDRVHLLEQESVEQSNSMYECCLLYTSPSPRDKRQSRMPSSA